MAPSSVSKPKPGIPSIPTGSNSLTGGDALFNTKGSWKGDGHGLPNSGRRPSFGKENAGGSKGFNLPPVGSMAAGGLDGRKSSGTGKKSSGPSQFQSILTNRVCRFVCGTELIVPIMKIPIVLICAAFLRGQHHFEDLKGVLKSR
eukprot:g10526.t1